MLTDKLKPFSSFCLHDREYDKKLDAYCVSDEIRHTSRSLLNHNCPICQRTFTQFELLRTHARKAHERFYCDLCVGHLTLFSSEKKMYSRPDLVKHRRVGDTDDTSHRGHPICQFCDERYFDNDELLVHLRRNHFFCHLCDKDGRQDYYVNYSDLMQHCKEEHFVCEQGNCAGEKFTNVFRSELDLQAHDVKFHKKGKSARVLPIEVTYISGRQSVITVEDYEDVNHSHQSSSAAASGHRQLAQHRQAPISQLPVARENEQRSRASELSARAKEREAAKPQRKAKEKQETRKSKVNKQTLEQDKFQPKLNPPPGFGGELSLPASVKNDTPSPLAEEDFPLLGATTNQSSAIPEQWKSRSLQDFPALASKRDSQCVDYGRFSKTAKKQSRPPPGLSASSKSLPPGLSQSATNVSTAAKEAADRNEALTMSIQEILDNDSAKFSHFRMLSAQFRNGLLSSDEYYSSCISLAGKKRFEKIFPELVGSLPDPVRREELISAHNRATAFMQRSDLPILGNWGSKSKKYLEEFPALSAVQTRAV